jgi:hypothetical protein
MADLRHRFCLVAGRRRNCSLFRPVGKEFQQRLARVQYLPTDDAPNDFAPQPAIPENMSRHAQLRGGLDLCVAEPIAKLTLCRLDLGQGRAHSCSNDREKGVNIGRIELHRTASAHAGQSSM